MALLLLLWFPQCCYCERGCIVDVGCPSMTAILWSCVCCGLVCYDSTMAVCYNSNVGGGVGEEGREGGCIIFASVYS